MDPDEYLFDIAVPVAAISDRFYTGDDTRHLFCTKGPSHYTFMLIAVKEKVDFYHEVPRRLFIEVGGMQILDPSESLESDCFSLDVPIALIEAQREIHVCLKPCGPKVDPNHQTVVKRAAPKTDICDRVFTSNVYVAEILKDDLLILPKEIEGNSDCCPIKILTIDDGNPETVWLTPDWPFHKKLGPGGLDVRISIRDPVHWTIVHENRCEFDLLDVIKNSRPLVITPTRFETLTCDWDAAESGLRFQLEVRERAQPVVLSLVVKVPSIDRGWASTRKLGFGYGKAVVHFFYEDFESLSSEELLKTVRLSYHSCLVESEFPDRILPAFMCHGVPPLFVGTLRAAIDFAQRNPTLIQPQFAQWVENFINEVPRDAYFSFIRFVRANSPKKGASIRHDKLDGANPDVYVSAVAEGILIAEKVFDGPLGDPVRSKDATLTYFALRCAWWSLREKGKSVSNRVFPGSTLHAFDALSLKKLLPEKGYWVKKS